MCYEQAIVPFFNRHNKDQNNSTLWTFPERPFVAQFSDSQRSSINWQLTTRTMEKQNTVSRVPCRPLFLCCHFFNKPGSCQTQAKRHGAVFPWRLVFIKIRAHRRLLSDWPCLRGQSLNAWLQSAFPGDLDGCPEHPSSTTTRLLRMEVG